MSPRVFRGTKVDLKGKDHIFTFISYKPNKNTKNIGDLPCLLTTTLRFWIAQSRNIWFRSLSASHVITYNDIDNLVILGR